MFGSVEGRQIVAAEDLAGCWVLRLAGNGARNKRREL